MPIITLNLNIDNLRTTSDKSINLVPLEILLNNLWKMLKQRQRLLLRFSRCYCKKIGRYCDRPSGAQGVKGLKLQQKNQKYIANLFKLLEKWLTCKIF